MLIEIFHSDENLQPGGARSPQAALLFPAGLTLSPHCSFFFFTSCASRVSDDLCRLRISPSTMVHAASLCWGLIEFNVGDSKG